MAEKDDKKPEPVAIGNQGGKKKKLIIIAGGALLLIIILGVAAFFLLKKDPAKEEKHGDEPAAVHAPDLNPSATIGPMVEIKEFIVNIISEGDRHYVKASMTIELVGSAGAAGAAGGGGHGEAAGGKDPATEEVTQRMPQIRDSILMLIGNKTYDELQDIQGKKQLKAELISKLNSILHKGKVKEIYFTDFIVQ
ncbi:MAG: flagellar basal body-associated FliL family protein [Desulfobulbaceae bacterium]|nr:flagellar basal body-associated FliL family protein [Desulfobulbaceae bacterium]